MSSSSELGWNWVDQKNEATRLLREGFGRATDRLADSSGLRRHELVIAAHTVLVLSCFFDAARATLGKSFAAANMTDPEKVMTAVPEFELWAGQIEHAATCRRSREILLSDLPER